MISKKDLQTSTVEGAAGFERARAKEHDQMEQDDAEDAMWDDLDEDIEDQDPYCNCSDPGCPCGGI